MSEVSWFRGGGVCPRTPENTHDLTPENPNHVDSDDCVCGPKSSWDSEMRVWFRRHNRVQADGPARVMPWDLKR